MKIFSLILLAIPLLASAADANNADETRWKQLQTAIFGDRPVEDGSGFMRLEAPDRAHDAALVPIGVELTGGKAIKSVYVIVDNNPGPLAGHFSFGPKADPRTVKMRVRVNVYTNIHAVAETQDDKLYSIAKYVKAAGGCSAPAGPDNEAALKDMGRMKLRPLTEFAPGKPMQAQLMIRHPNFNGMQMDQITRYVTPARYIRTIDVTYNGEQVFRLESDISLSTDPVLTFGFIPDRPGELKVVARDTNDTVFTESFNVPVS